MKTLAALACTLLLLVEAGCGNGASPPAAQERVTPTEQTGPCASMSDTATFEITFTGTWTAASHPGDFPAGAHFSTPIGAAHGTIDIVWVRDGASIASDGIEAMAELGTTAALSAEIDAYIAGGAAFAKIVAAGGVAATGSTTATFTTSRDHPLLSVVAMVAPSPDWFVGVANFELCDGNDWIDDVTVDLALVYDSGTDSGPSFTSPNADQTPHVPIHLVADEGNHFLGNPAPVATLRIRRLP